MDFQTALAECPLIAIPPSEFLPILRETLATLLLPPYATQSRGALECSRQT